MATLSVDGVEANTTQRDAFIERMLQSAAGFFDIFTIYLGQRLGYYHVLAMSEPVSSQELAAQTNTQERYAREWLEQQAVSGILGVQDAALSGSERKYFLPAGYGEVLADTESLNYLAPLAQMLVGVGLQIESVIEAYRTGQGVPYLQYGSIFREGQASMNRTMFLQELGRDWLPKLEDIHARLQSEPAARIADIGTGAGWSSIGIAQAYPHVQIDGYDLDQPSIELAWQNARLAGLEDRVRFSVHDAADPSLHGRYDLVTVFEALHDMSYPVGALRTMRRMINGSGAVLVVDERVEDQFRPEGNEVEWIMYGWSVLHCLPVGMAESHSAATGTVMRYPTLRKYAHEAGFSDVVILPIENYFFRFYQLIP